MKTDKKRRRAYRRALHDAQMVRPDRFTDLMYAITGGGTRPCACCGLAWTIAELNERSMCQPCQRALGKLRTRVPQPGPIATILEPDVVWADASFSDGIAGIAICGALGEHSQLVEAKTSTQAEVMALRWAMEIAKAGNRYGLTFRTDCQAAFKAWRQTPKRWEWTVEQIPRRQNRRADELAGMARMAA